MKRYQKLSLSAQHPTQRALDWWESPRFQAVCVAWSWFRQTGVVSARPPEGNPANYAGAGRQPLRGFRHDINRLSINYCKQKINVRKARNQRRTNYQLLTR
jgi:hypothetical protein